MKKKKGVCGVGVEEKNRTSIDYTVRENPEL